MDAGVTVRETAAGRRGADSRILRVLVVDPRFDAYRDLAAAARLGYVQLHFRSSAGTALAIMRRVRFDRCIVGTELDDMPGEEFVEILRAVPDRSCHDVVAFRDGHDLMGTLRTACGTVAVGEPDAATGGTIRESGADSEFVRSLVVSAAAAAAAIGLLLAR